MSLSPDDILARYIFNKRYIDEDDGSVEPAAFMPRHGETSVANITHLSDPQVWAYGDTHVAIPGRVIIGRADVKCKHVIDAKLTLDPSRPPSIHVNIKGWPASESEALLKATLVAQNAIAVVR